MCVCVFIDSGCKLTLNKIQYPVKPLGLFPKNELKTQTFWTQFSTSRIPTLVLIQVFLLPTRLWLTQIPSVSSHLFSLFLRSQFLVPGKHPFFPHKKSSCSPRHFPRAPFKNLLSSGCFILAISYQFWFLLFKQKWYSVSSPELRTNSSLHFIGLYL